MARPENLHDVQFNFFEDHVSLAGERVQKAVKTSWAASFGDRVYPMIKESLFDPLYSTQGRPAAPTNVLVGACILQLLLGISEDELFLRMLTDLTIQYALHRTTDEKLPFSKVTFRRFKMRMIHYYEVSGEDLFQKCCQEILDKMKEEEKPMTRFLRRIGRLSVQDLYSQSRREAGKSEEAAGNLPMNGQENQSEGPEGTETEQGGRKDETGTGTNSGGTSGCADDA